MKERKASGVIETGDGAGGFGIFSGDRDALLLVFGDWHAFGIEKLTWWTPLSRRRKRNRTEACREAHCGKPWRSSRSGAESSLERRSWDFSGKSERRTSSSCFHHFLSRSETLRAAPAHFNLNTIRVSLSNFQQKKKHLCSFWVSKPNCLSLRPVSNNFFLGVFIYLSTHFNRKIAVKTQTKQFRKDNNLFTEARDLIRPSRLINGPNFKRKSFLKEFF